MSKVFAWESSTPIRCLPCQVVCARSAAAHLDPARLASKQQPASSHPSHLVQEARNDSRHRSASAFGKGRKPESQNKRNPTGSVPPSYRKEQCPRRIANERQTYEERAFSYCRSAVMSAAKDRGARVSSFTWTSVYRKGKSTNPATKWCSLSYC